MSGRGAILYFHVFFTPPTRRRPPAAGSQNPSCSRVTQKRGGYLRARGRTRRPPSMRQRPFRTRSRGVAGQGSRKRFRMTCCGSDAVTRHDAAPLSSKVAASPSARSPTMRRIIGAASIQPHHSARSAGYLQNVVGTEPEVSPALLSRTAPPRLECAARTRPDSGRRWLEPLPPKAALVGCQPCGHASRTASWLG